LTTGARVGSDDGPAPVATPVHWEDLLARSAHHTAFARPEYVRLMTPLSKGEATTVSDSVASVGCIGIARQRGPIKDFGLPLFTPYSGVELPETTEASIHAKNDPLAGLAILLESRFDRIRIHLPPTVEDVRPLQWRGWNVSPLFTYVLAPGSGQAAWSAGARRTLRKSGEDYRVRIEPEAAGDVVNLMLESYRRQGRTTPADPGILTHACRSLIQSGDADCVVARDGHGEAAAGIILLHGPESSYYWIAGGVPGPAMTVLMAFALEFLADKGTKAFDMVGANTPTIAEFKRRFGPTLVRYWAAGYESGLALRALTAGKSLLGR